MKFLNVDLDEELHRQLKIAAATHRLTIRAAVRVAIVEWIKHTRRTNDKQHSPVSQEASNQ
jgi:plasmid stability protein